MGQKSTLYHVTTKENAAKILAEGFRDGNRTEPQIIGVWLSAEPLDANSGAWGDTVLMVQFQVPLRRLKHGWIDDPCNELLMG